MTTDKLLLELKEKEAEFDGLFEEIDKTELAYSAGMGGKMFLKPKADIDVVIDDLEKQGFWDQYK